MAVRRGANLERAEDAAKKRMSVERPREMRGQLNEWGVLAQPTEIDSIVPGRRELLHKVQSPQVFP